MYFVEASKQIYYGHDWIIFTSLVKSRNCVLRTPVCGTEWGKSVIPSKESAKLCGIRALVLYVLGALRALVPHVPHAFCALVPQMSCALCVLVLHVPGALRVSMLYEPRTLRTLVSHVSFVIHALVLDLPRAFTCLLPSVLSCLTCSHPLRALVAQASYVLFCLTYLVPCVLLSCLCPTCSCAPHPSLASGVSSLTGSWFPCLVPLVLLLFELFEFFTTCAKVHEYGMSFFQKKPCNNVFSYKRVSDVNLQNPLTLIHRPISFHWSLSIASENIKKSLVFREYKDRPVTRNELIH